MKRSVVSLMLQSCYKISLTDLEAFTARADYLRTLVWLQGSEDLIADRKDLAYAPVKEKPFSITAPFGWKVPPYITMGQEIPAEYVHNALPPGYVTFDEACRIANKMNLGGLKDRYLLLDHAKNASAFFGARPGGKSVLARGFGRELRFADRIKGSGESLPTKIMRENNPPWVMDEANIERDMKEDMDKLVDRKMDELAQRRMNFLNGVWDPEFKDAYERDMVKKGGH